jgi:hypothetical protein
MLTEAHCAAVAAEIPAGVEVPQEFWRDLDAAITLFCAMAERRTSKPLPRGPLKLGALTEHGPLKQWSPRDQLKQWQRIVELTDALAAELRDLRRQPSGDHSDRAWPSRGLRDLWPIRFFAESNLIALESLSAGRRPHREFLYAGILDLWEMHLGQPLKYSRSGEQGLPGGPLIRFFTACIGPVLGDDAPTLEGIIKIIKRERKRRRLSAALREGRVRAYAPLVEIKPAEIKPIRRRRHGTLKPKK